MNNVMLDLETMGTGPNAAIIAIGAVAFEPTGGLGSTFYRVVELASSVEYGGEIDVSTILWWMKQSDAARGEFARLGIHIHCALDDFSLWIKGYKAPVKVWGNGAAFDNVILRSAFVRAGIEVPWQYSNDRCYRTIKATRPDIKVAPLGTAHNALDDAMHQAGVLMSIVTEGGMKM
jgi:DNA polymerase III epsilon subunit-like protein